MKKIGQILESATPIDTNQRNRGNKTEPTPPALKNHDTDERLSEFVKSVYSKYNGEETWSGKTCDCCGVEFRFSINKAMEDLDNAKRCNSCSSQSFSSRREYLENEYPDINGIDGPTNINHESFNREFYDSIMRWDMDEKNIGCYIYGESGTSKSRILRLKVIDYLSSHPEQTFLVIYGAEINEVIRQGYRENKTNALKDKFMNHDIVVIDDMAIDAMSSSALSDFRGIIDAAYRQGSPRLMIASNFDPMMMADRLSEKGGEGDLIVARTISKRIKNMCYVRCVKPKSSN